MSALMMTTVSTVLGEISSVYTTAILTICIVVSASLVGLLLSVLGSRSSRSSSRVPSLRTLPCLTTPSSLTVVELTNSLWTSDSDTSQVSEQVLISMLVRIFELHGLTSSLNVSKLHVYLLRIKDNYRANPYHNFRHACHVTLNGHRLLSALSPSVYRQLSAEEKVAFFWGAISHDLDHLGKGNDVLLKERHELTRTHGTISILENHSISIAVKLLDEETKNPLNGGRYRSKESNFLEGMSPASMAVVCEVFKSIILSTDIGNHENNTRLTTRWDALFSSSSSSSASSSSSTSSSSSSSSSSAPSSCSPYPSRRRSSSPRGSLADASSLSSSSRSSSSSLSKSSAAVPLGGGGTLSPADRVVLLSMLLRIADIGALSQAFRIFLRWSLALFDEKGVVGASSIRTEMYDFVRMQEKFLKSYATPEIKRVCDATDVLGTTGEAIWTAFRRNTENYYKLSEDERISELLSNAVDLTAH